MNSRDDRIHPAATVVCLREEPPGPSVLLLRRSSGLVFHGGDWVFPGGRVDEGDEGPGESRDSLGAARRAAIREVSEEAGLSVPEGKLVPLSHWTTPPGNSRCFATWFFLCGALEGQQVRVDGREVDAHRWLAPREALRAHAAGQIVLPAPTFVTVSWLAAFSSAAMAVEMARSSPPERFAPKVAESSGRRVSLYEGDAGYLTGDPDVPGPRHRLWVSPRGFLYERTR